jgi:hypothetical protein
MKRLYDLSEHRKLEIFNQVSTQTGLPPAAIEKDWWVTLVLKAIFSLPFSKYIVFKGGTSLSKGWKLIERFSEDIDLAVNPAFFGFKGDLTKGEVRRLRKKSCEVLSTEFPGKLESLINKIGISKFDLSVKDFDASDTDPIEVQLHYSSITEKSDYLNPWVIIEVGSRSLIEPFEKRPIRSLVGEIFTEQEFADSPEMLPTVLPKRTFLEKAFLLHEEYKRLPEKIKSERKSRHLYDLEKIMDTEHGKEALKDIKLYNSIVKHREKFAHLSGVDYASHGPEKIDFIPPEEVIGEWESDYKVMQENMIYGESLAFPNLIKRLVILRDRFREIKTECYLPHT